MRTTLLGLLAALSMAFAPLAVPGKAEADPLVSGGEHCVINIPTDDTLNMREAPGTGSRVLTRLPYAQCGVTLIDDCQYDWCPVENGHYRGWAHRRYLAAVSPARYCVTGVAEWDVLNLRAWPAPTSRVLTELDPGQCDIAFLPYATGNWQKVRVDGWEGWVNRRFLSGQ
jgi:SH3-like domain-containing protein